MSNADSSRESVPTSTLSSLNISSSSTATATATEITYRAYSGERDLQHIVKLVDDELSEPYNLYTYRYFLDTWPHLCFFAFSNQGQEPIGVIISKLEPHKKDNSRMRGYLAMLSVSNKQRGKGIATHLLRLSITSMMLSSRVDEIVLETESDNEKALNFYGKFGFVREKELYRFYLNGKRAARLKLDLGKMRLL
jgi:peptide alpha-N-acetyltransferase